MDTVPKKTTKRRKHREDRRQTLTKSYSDPSVAARVHGIWAGKARKGHLASSFQVQNTQVSPLFRCTAWKVTLKQSAVREMLNSGFRTAERG